MVYSVQKALHCQERTGSAELILQPLVLRGDLALQLRQADETIVISLHSIVLRLRHVRLAREQEAEALDQRVDGGAITDTQRAASVLPRAWTMEKSGLRCVCVLRSSEITSGR